MCANASELFLKKNALDHNQTRFFASIRPKEELYFLKEDPYELNNLASDPEYTDILKSHATILDNWIEETDDHGQYPEDEENLKLMLGIWGKYAVNPEYEILRKKFPDLSGSQFELKSQKWQEVE